MMYHDSHEVLALRKMIENKKKFLLSVKTEFTYQQIQKEILFLENEILPIVLRSTNIIHSEFCNYAILAYDTALKYRCNGLLMYQPLEENYTDRPIIGIVNKRANLAFGTSAVDSKATSCYSFLVSIRGFFTGTPCHGCNSRN